MKEGFDEWERKTKRVDGDDVCVRANRNGTARKRRTESPRSFVFVSGEQKLLDDDDDDDDDAIDAEKRRPN